MEKLEVGERILTAPWPSSPSLFSAFCDKIVAVCNTQHLSIVHLLVVDIFSLHFQVVHLLVVDIFSLHFQVVIAHKKLYSNEQPVPSNYKLGHKAVLLMSDRCICDKKK